METFIILDLYFNIFSYTLFRVCSDQDLYIDFSLSLSRMECIALANITADFISRSISTRGTGLLCHVIQYSISHKICTRSSCGFVMQYFFFSCDQAALRMAISVCLSVCLSVCPSVRLSVTPFWQCCHHRIIMKFSGVITNDQSDGHANSQGQRSKVKVTEVNTQLNRFRTVTQVWIHIWWWNDAYSLVMLTRGALLFFNVTRQISRSHGSKKRRIWPRLGVSGL